MKPSRAKSVVAVAAVVAADVAATAVAVAADVAATAVAGGGGGRRY